MEIPVFYIILVLAFLIGCITIKRQEPYYLKLAVLYLFMNLVAETAGLYLKSKGARNYWIYNISTTLEFVFYFYIYYRAITLVPVKRAIKYGGTVIILFCVANMLFIQKMDHFHSYSFLLGSVGVIFLSILYLRQLLMNSFLINPVRKKMFWISMGVFFSYMGTFFYLGLFEIVHYQNRYFEYQLGLLLNVLNAILYLMYIFSFYARETK